MLLRPRVIALLSSTLILSACALSPSPVTVSPAAAVAVHLTPGADHHQHIFSPAAAAGEFFAPLPEVQLPRDLSGLLARRRQVWNNPEALAKLYAEDAAVLNLRDQDMRSWLRGPEEAADYMSRLFAREYVIKPISYRVSGSTALIEGYYVRADNGRHMAHAMLTLKKDPSGTWRIAAEAPAFPGPPTAQSIGAERLIELLDEGGIERAAVISNAFWFGSDFQTELFPSRTLDQERELVEAENDWVADQISRHPRRLLGFCSFNPLKAYALAELERCTGPGKLTGLKLHFGNSRVDLRNAQDLDRIRQVFAAANERRVPVIVHLWTDPSYEREGGEYARIFIDEVLPAAPDIPIQIAHMAGGGRSTDTALEVFAGAIAADDPRTRNLYFDVAGGITEGQSVDALRQDALRMRQLGLHRILYGTDTSPPSEPPRKSWALFRMVPLTDEEFRIIATNVAPYFR